MIAGILGLFIAIAIVAGIASGLALLLEAKARGFSIIIRSLIAGFAAGLLAIILPVIGVLRLSERMGPVVAIVPLLIAAAVFGLLVGFPVALFVARRRARNRGAPVDPEMFD